MNELGKYRSIIKIILTEYAKIANIQDTSNRKFEASDRLAFDETRDRYLWFRFGWEEKN